MHIDKGTIQAVRPEDVEKINNMTTSGEWTHIESFAFRNTFTRKDGPNFLKIPEGVFYIKDSAFYGAENLTEIVLPSTIKFIEREAFRLSGIKEIKIPENVRVIESLTFSNCEDLKNITLPNSLKQIGAYAFKNCVSLETIKIPESVEYIDTLAFFSCTGLKSVTISSETFVDPYAFNQTYLSGIAFSEDGELFLHQVNKDDKPLVEVPSKFQIFRRLDPEIHFGYNYRQNMSKCISFKNNKKINFIPPDYILKSFPTDYIQNFFINNNHLRWRNIVSAFNETYVDLHYSNLSVIEHNKNLFLNDLFRLYYSIGGFSPKQNESEKAHQYMLEYLIHPGYETNDGKKNLAVPYREDIYNHYSSLHGTLSRFTLSGEHNQSFAQFFMRYHQGDHKFMFLNSETFEEESPDKDFLAQVHNNWQNIINLFPNRVVNGNTLHDLLTPSFVAKHSMTTSFYGINPGNEELALTLGQYGYSQSQFEEMQAVFDFAKTLKEKCVIRADKSKEFDCINFRILEKDDPLGFILGDITNCCQAWGGAAKSCVEDGYKNPNSAFLVFEETIKDKDGKPTDKKRILGQAYVWYDPITRTVCMDNIEIPTGILRELTSSKATKNGVSLSEFLDIIEYSAKSIKNTMNRNNTRVNRVTIGSGFNDLSKHLKTRYNLITHNLARNPSSGVYSDANSSQFVILSR